MTDSNTRKGTRQKKIPRHFQPQETQYIPFVHTKINQSKDKIATTLDKNLLANILCRFIQKINQKYKFIQQSIREEGFQKIISFDIQNKVNYFSPVNKTRQNNKLNGNFHNLKNKETKLKSWSERERKIKMKQKISTNQNEQKQVNFNYNIMLCQHLKNEFPNISDISLNKLNSFDLSRHLIQNSCFNQPAVILGKTQIQQSFRNNNPDSFSINEENQLRSFKNQAYHLTIAYYIHSKRQKMALSKTNTTSIQQSLHEQTGNIQKQKATNVTKNGSVKNQSIFLK